MADTSSTDSFVTVRSDDLLGKDQELEESATKEEYKTAPTGLSSEDRDERDEALQREMDSAILEESTKSTLKDIESLSNFNGSNVSSSTFDDSSWQDLETDTLSAYLRPLKEIEDEEKRDVIVTCLKKGDVRSLKKLGQQEGGFLCDELRRLVWPKVAKVDVFETSPRPDAQTMEAHPFYTQVVLDVNRSLKRFPPSIEEQQRLSMQDQLVRLIMRVLIKNPQLYYYQGYHDICVTFLLILGEEMAFHVVNALSKSHLSMFMEETMESTANLLEVIPILVSAESAALGDFLKKSEVGTVFSLSWVITWFSHVLRDYRTVGRLFDLLLVSHNYMPLYLTAAIVLYKEEAVLQLDCDMASVHQYLGRLMESEDDLPFEQLILKATSLKNRYPPDKMQQKLILLKEKQKKQQVVKRRHFLLRKYLSFRGILELGSSFGFLSVTVFMVFCASLVQYYWKRH